MTMLPKHSHLSILPYNICVKIVATMSSFVLLVFYGVKGSDSCEGCSESSRYCLLAT